MTEQERAIELELLVRGDADALQRLIVEYHGILLRFVADRLEPELGAQLQPEDLLQDAYVHAFRSIAECRFDGPAGFYKWLEAIALNRLRDAKRALKRGKRDVDRLARGGPDASTSYPDLINRLAADQSTPSRQAVREEAIAAMMTCLARLSDDQRAVVHLRYIERLAVADVARQLNKPEEAIHTLCSRGLRRLRVLLGSMTTYLARQ